MHNHLAYLKRKYKDKIYPCEKSTSDIMLHIETAYNVIKYDVCPRNYEAILRCTIENIVNNPLSINLMNLSAEQLDIALFEVSKTPKNKKYYSHDNYVNNGILYEQIYIILESNTHYIYSNNSYINCEFNVYKGIANDDIQNNTYSLTNYLLWIEGLEEKNEKKDFYDTVYRN